MIAIGDTLIVSIGSAPRCFVVGTLKREEDGFYVIEDRTRDDGVYDPEGSVTGYRTVKPEQCMAFDKHLWQDLAWEQISYRAAIARSEVLWNMAKLKGLGSTYNVLYGRCFGTGKLRS